MDKKTLKIQLVPDGCWGFNLRTVLPLSAWKIVKAEVKRRANGKCEICGAKTSALDAHECWEYDEKLGIQKLCGIIAVCKDCHSVIHIGRTSVKGDIIRAEEHYKKVNGATYAEYREALRQANADHARRNKVSEWSLDITYLKKYFEQWEGKEKENGNN